MIEAVFTALGSLLSSIDAFQRRKIDRIYKSPLIAVRPSLDFSNPNRTILKIRVRNEGVSTISHVTFFGRNIGKINPGEEKDTEFFYDPRIFDLYDDKLYISCFNEYGKCEFEFFAIDHRYFKKSNNTK